MCVESLCILRLVCLFAFLTCFIAVDVELEIIDAQKFKPCFFFVCFPFFYQVALFVIRHFFAPVVYFNVIIYFLITAVPSAKNMCNRLNFM